MTLQELHDQLAPSFPVSIRKDLKTSVSVLSKALQYPDPQHCSLDQCNQPLLSLYQRVEAYLSAQGKTAHTIRNTKNNLSRLFRLAEGQGLFSLSPALPKELFTLKTRLPRPGSSRTSPNGTHLSYKNWPHALQESFTTFATWATDPYVEGRPASLRKRLPTIEGYRIAFESYFGFLRHIQQLPTLTFDQLFDITLVTAYVYWHVNELHHRVTSILHTFFDKLLTLTKQYRPLPEFREQLHTLYQTLPSPLTVYNKEDAWVPLDTLNKIGRELWPRKPLHSIRHDQHTTGTRHALHAGISLLLQLWTYIPFRQRNIREMQLEENLYKDVHGHWHIRFQREQLKIAIKRGRPNIFHLSFPAALVSRLEAYLTIWRPLLLKQTPNPSSLVFLTQRGNPFNAVSLRSTTSNIVYRYTGKHWHPHIVRSVWATEWIRGGGDFYYAAMMLNDSLETVITTYSHLRDQNIAEDVYATLDRRYGQSK